MNRQFSVLSSQFSLRAACVATILMGGTLAFAADAPAYDAEKFVAEKAPALVTIKFNLRSGATEGDEQSESEITGVAIDPKGLILCSNAQLTGGGGGLPGLSMGGGAGVPTNIRVAIGDDAQGLKAKLLARDSELDLAWIELTEAPPKPLVYIDLAKAAKPRLGQSLISMHRMGKYFDREPAIREVKVSAHPHKPRELYILGGSLNVDFGLPVFTLTGEPVGILILPISEDSAEELRGNPLSMLGGISGILDLISGAILPADEVVKATQRARENPQAQPADDDGKKPTTRPAVDSEKDDDDDAKPAAKDKSDKKPAVKKPAKHKDKEDDEKEDDK